MDNTLAENEWLLLSNEFIANHGDDKGYSCQSEIVQIFTNKLYPMLGKLATFRMALPVHTASCEWGFSQLKLIKTDLQNRLNQDGFDNLMFIAIEDWEALKRWSKQRERRIPNTPPTYI